MQVIVCKFFLVFILSTFKPKTVFMLAFVAVTCPILWTQPYCFI